MNDVASRPLAANGQVLASFGAGQRLAVDRHLGALTPPWNSQIESERRGLCRSNCDLDATIPRIVRLLLDFEPGAVLQMPVELRVVVKMDIDAVAACAVEIPWERAKRALQIRRTTGHVVPRIANLVSG